MRVSSSSRARRGPARWAPPLLIVLVLAVAAVWCAVILSGGKPEPQPEASSAAAGEPSPSAAPDEPEPEDPLPERFQLEVPFLGQVEEWPTGCESVTAVMALNQAGIDVTVGDFVWNYLPLGSAPYEGMDGELYASNPNRYFLGNPASEDGMGCYAPVIYKAVSDLLEDRGAKARIVDVTGASLDDLCRDWVYQGTPVMVWASIDMAEPWRDVTFIDEETGEAFDWIYPLHCLLLTGWDREHYYFNDPLEDQNTAYSKRATRRAYDFLGQQALVVVSN